MKKNLRRIAPLKTGIVSGVIYALLGLLLVPIFMLGGAAAAAATQESGADFPFGFFFGIGALFFPIIYGAIGFVSGVICAAIYNLVAKWTGGLELTFEDVA